MRPRLQDILSEDDDYVITMEIARERKAKMQRWARRYLDEHCDSRGVRLPSGMWTHEYAAEIGWSRQDFGEAVTAEKRRRLERATDASDNLRPVGVEEEWQGDIPQA